MATARQLATLVRATRASYVLHIGGELGYTNLHIVGGHPNPDRNNHQQ